MPKRRTRQQILADNPTLSSEPVVKRAKPTARDEHGRQTPFVATAEQAATVRAMAAYGVPQNDICLVIGCSKPTLERHFRRELDTAMIEANAKVAQSLFQMATVDKQVAAAIYWLKVRAKWKEPAQQVELTGRDGGPMMSVVSDDPIEAARAYQQLMGE